MALCSCGVGERKRLSSETDDFLSEQDCNGIEQVMVDWMLIGRGPQVNTTGESLNIMLRQMNSANVGGQCENVIAVRSPFILLLIAGNFLRFVKCAYHNLTHALA
eukprot:TRINITY_DN10764_c0_g1_i1.p2 TRINITY_DN10764_c0_g1~~TRINITY_DN10764_c0_g1_i1.p2  ORF type:complete len:105 (+),score=20.75 TRINITY_DN10764_c0_g1_i1:130-444(+)